MFSWHGTAAEAAGEPKESFIVLLKELKLENVSFGRKQVVGREQVGVCEHPLWKRSRNSGKMHLTEKGVFVMSRQKKVSLDRSFMFKDVKKDLLSGYGSDTASRIWNRGNELLGTYPALYPQISYRLAGQYVFALAAIYSAMLEENIGKEDAASFLIRYGSRFGEKMKKMIHGITSIPGVSSLIWKNIDKMMHKAGGEGMGYESEFLPKTETDAGMNVLKCPLHEALKTMGVPEIAPTICAMDKVYMTGIRGITYQRTKSVAEGGDCCDYRLKRILK